jgi:hypothetical protein
MPSLANKSRRVVGGQVIADALVRIGEYVADHGLCGNGPYLPARDLLLRERPRVSGEPLRGEGESLSLIPLIHMLSKVAALGRWCWRVQDEERCFLQSFNHPRFLLPPWTKRNGIRLRVVVEGNLARFVVYDNAHW